MPVVERSITLPTDAEFYVETMYQLRETRNCLGLVRLLFRKSGQQLSPKEFAEVMRAAVEPIVAAQVTRYPEGKDKEDYKRGYLYQELKNLVRDLRTLLGLFSKAQVITEPDILAFQNQIVKALEELTKWPLREFIRL